MEQACGDDGLHVEVIQDTSGWATVYWWNQADEDKQMHIIVTNITAGSQNQFESQPDVTLFYLPMHLTNDEDYSVTVRGPTTHEEVEVTFHADENQVTVEQTSRTTATVRWPAELSQHSDVEITLKEVTKENVTEKAFNWTAREQPFHIPHTLTMGQQYRVTVRWVDAHKELKTRFRAEFTRAELEKLHEVAELFMNGVLRDDDVLPCEVFYRNSTEEYFDDCYTKHNHIMSVYLKGNSGDPASIINGQISGLFFMANVEFDGMPFKGSPFGPKRVSIPAMGKFSTDANLYFADFYCMNTTRGTHHYVTLVLTTPNSNVDHFCQHKKLIKLDNRNNIFLMHRTDDDGEVLIGVTTKVMVEVFYTENVVLPDRETLTTVPPSGTTTPGGIPKHPYCSRCNLPTDQDLGASQAS